MKVLGVFGFELAREECLKFVLIEDIWRSLVKMTLLSPLHFWEQ
jgi:hypothetical protein